MTKLFAIKSIFRTYYVLCKRPRCYHRANMIKVKKRDFFTKKVLFVGQLIPLPWTSGDISSGLQSQIGGIHFTCSLRSTSGATPADPWWPASQLSHSLPHTCEQALAQTCDCLQCKTRQTVLPTELCRLSYNKRRSLN